MPDIKNALVPVYRAETGENQRFHKRLGILERPFQSYNMKEILPLFISIGNPERTIEFMKQRRDQNVEGWKKKFDAREITRQKYEAQVKEENSGRRATIRTTFIPVALARKIVETAEPEHGSKFRVPDVINVDVTKSYNQFGIRGPVLQEFMKASKVFGVFDGIW